VGVQERAERCAGTTQVKRRVHGAMEEQAVHQRGQQDRDTVGVEVVSARTGPTPDAVGEDLA
jgi:hypothetical protein